MKIGSNLRHYGTLFGPDLRRKCSNYFTQTFLGKSATVIVFMAQFSAQIFVKT